MGPGLIFGVIIILVGLSILFKDFPFFRIIFGVLIILWGISVLTGGFGHRWNYWKRTDNNVVFGQWNFDSKDDTKEYNVVFGKGTYDFRNVTLPPEGKELSLHTAFGASEVLINKSTPVKISANSAFGEVRMPNGNSAAFGSLNYTNDAYRPDSACLSLKIDLAFGSVKVIEY